MAPAPWRIIAQRILTSEWLSWDVPLRQSTSSWTLSGPGSINGLIDPEVAHHTASDGRPLLEEWGTALYVEQDGQIRNGALVNSVQNQGSTRRVQSIGFCGYPHQLPFTDDYIPTAFEDPVDTFKGLWAKLQSYPDGDLGLNVNGPSTYFVLSDGQGPYKVFSYEYRDSGQTLDSIAQVTPFDYLETHTWTDDTHTAIRHDLDVAFPRVGRKREDLRFAGGENVIGVSTIAADGTRYANDVRMIGRGSGRAMPTARAAVRDGRLRRATVVPWKSATQGMLNRRVQQELKARQMLLDISSVKVQDHPNARLTALQPGDDVLVQVEVPWVGDVRIWLRVLSVQVSGDTPGVATLKTIRSDYYTYAAGKSPTGDTIVLTL